MTSRAISAIRSRSRAERRIFACWRSLVLIMSARTMPELMALRKLDEVALAIALEREGDPHYRGGAQRILQHGRRRHRGVLPARLVRDLHRTAGSCSRRKRLARSNTTTPIDVCSAAILAGWRTTARSARWIRWSMPYAPPAVCRLRFLNLHRSGRIAVGMKADDGGARSEGLARQHHLSGAGTTPAAWTTCW